MKNLCSIGRFSIYILLAVISTTVKSANILVFAPLPFKSHFTGFLPMFKELANRGHNVTVLSAFPLKKPIANYTDIPIVVEESILKGYMRIKQKNVIQCLCGQIILVIKIYIFL